ncbi:hypothetical protein RF11_15961 [Thelohanellus kitauei]|uniref:Uncharacterized protein n=1 Tax=Thelohanellus kitauei TaxID=669202 RepID=A0A0C2MXZ5_THEKT|nr:hypothetical protein RF11_15961 [Thelohanellus kitauei]
MNDLERSCSHQVDMRQEDNRDRAIISNMFLRSNLLDSQPTIDYCVSINEELRRRIFIAVPMLQDVFDQIIRSDCSDVTNIIIRCILSDLRESVLRLLPKCEFNTDTTMRIEGITVFELPPLVQNQVNLSLNNIYSSRKDLIVFYG